MKYLNKIKILLISVFILTPVVVFGAVSDLQGLIKMAIGVVGSLVPLVMGLAVLAFVYGILKYLTKSGDPTARAEGNQFMIWGIVALFVMVSLWALVGVIKGTFFGSGGRSAGTMQIDSTRLYKLIQ